MAKKQVIKLTEQQLLNLASKIARKMVNEAESYGWVVDDNEAQEAYQFAAQRLGTERINQDIVDTIGNETLAKCLAFIFRMNDFREWDEYKSQQANGEESDDALNESIRKAIKSYVK